MASLHVYSIYASCFYFPQAGSGQLHSSREVKAKFWAMNTSKWGVTVCIFIPPRRWRMFLMSSGGWQKFSYSCCGVKAWNRHRRNEYIKNSPFRVNESPYQRPKSPPSSKFAPVPLSFCHKNLKSTARLSTSRTHTPHFFATSNLSNTIFHHSFVILFIKHQIRDYRTIRMPYMKLSVLVQPDRNEDNPHVALRCIEINSRAWKLLEVEAGYGKRKGWSRNEKEFELVSEVAFTNLATEKYIIMTENDEEHFLT